MLGQLVVSPGAAIHLPDVPPHADGARLAALQSFGALDSGSDPRIDAITRCAARLFAAPVAAVSLLDRDRRWAKPPIGSDARQTPRELAFSPHLLDSREPVMVVEDASRDPRFAHMPLVTGPDGIRFYAGAKLVDSLGHFLGTLCVSDHEPGTASPAQRDHLIELASAAVGALELHRSETALRHDRMHDPLTGLLNRASLQARLADAISGAATEDRRCVMLTIDLCRFSHVVDLAGHAGGEALLREAAQRLLVTVNPRETVARLGGDEFGIVIPAVASSRDAQALADEVIDLLARPFIIAGEPILVNPSVGIAGFPDDAGNAEDLMRRSADALYWAKRRGRNRAYHFDAGLHQQLMGQHLLERDLRAALASSAFALDWQPFVSAGTGRLLGYEAFLRWDRPGHGPVPPGVLMAAAERYDLATSIDRWVLDAACHAAAAWPNALTVAVNLSTASVQRLDIVGATARSLNESGLAAHRLQIEIGSQAFPGDGDAPAFSDASATVAGLRQLGVRVALNDFGACHSLLGQLRHVPFDTLKLNRALLDQLGVDERADAIAHAALQLGKALGVTLCATGVETRAEYAFLAEHGCDEVQGCFVAAPGLASSDPAFTHVAIEVWSDPADIDDPLGALRGIAGWGLGCMAMGAGLWTGLRLLLHQG
jgi:diguanylate cyclase (GGDEF)-like protein